jgi:hypothetical protein
VDNEIGYPVCGVIYNNIDAKELLKDQNLVDMPLPDAYTTLYNSLVEQGYTQEQDGKRVLTISAHYYRIGEKLAENEFETILIESGERNPFCDAVREIISFVDAVGGDNLQEEEFEIVDSIKNNPGYKMVENIINSTDPEEFIHKSDENRRDEEQPQMQEQPVTWQEVACSVCHGSGESTCEACGGTGQETCELCGGEGSVTCEQCGGTTLVPCTNCSSPGSGLCNGCNGTGVCKYCNGAGCAECDYQSGVTCKGCAGSGICGHCHGTLFTATCNRCWGYNGHPPCNRCNGEGAFECHSCGGTGSIGCYRCGGSGKEMVPITE